uniref:Uncharacterized protein n=1 Tax=Ursus maritimus TaxID=29073 RepID=A0A452T078_URSMA
CPSLFCFTHTGCLGHQSPQLPGSPRCPELMWVMGNQVWKFLKRHETGHLPPPYSLTGEGERRGRPVEGCPSEARPGVAAMRRNPGNCIDTKILIALVFFFFFCIKVCMVSNKGLKCNSL